MNEKITLPSQQHSRHRARHSLWSRAGSFVLTRLACLWFLSAIVVPTANAAIYQCTSEGRMLFSDLPCDGPQTTFVGIWMTYEEREALRIKNELEAIRAAQRKKTVKASQVDSKPPSTSPTNT